jgi:parallel beta-helix repeat protein
MATLQNLLALSRDTNRADIRVNSITVAGGSGYIPTDGTTDATSSINLALSSLTSGGRVQLPAGTFVISSPLILSNAYTTLEGSDGTILSLAAASNSDMIQVRASWCQIKNITLNCNASTQVSGSGVGIRVGSGSYSPYRTVIEKVWINDAYTTGIYITGISSSNQTSLTVVDTCDVQRCLTHGIYNDINAQDTQILNSFFQLNYNAGGYFDDCFGVVVVSSHFYLNRVRGVNIQNGGRVNLSNCTIDNNWQQGVLIQTSSSTGCARGHNINNCRFFNNDRTGAGASAITLDASASASTGFRGCNFNSIQGNVFYDEQAVPTQLIGINNSSSSLTGYVRNIIANNTFQNTVTTPLSFGTYFNANNATGPNVTTPA